MRQSASRICVVIVSIVVYFIPCTNIQKKYSVVHPIICFFELASLISHFVIPCFLTFTNIEKQPGAELGQALLKVELELFFLLKIQID